MINNNKVGQFIQLCRKGKGLTQQDLANSLHLTDKAVSKWERGLSLPDISILEPLANVLEISIAELLKGEKISNIEGDTLDKLLTDTADTFTKSSNKKYKRKLISLSIVFVLILITLSLFYSYKSLENDYFDVTQTLDGAITNGVYVYEYVTNSDGKPLAAIPKEDYKDALFCAGYALGAFEQTDVSAKNLPYLEQKVNQMQRSLTNVYDMLYEFDCVGDSYIPNDYVSFQKDISQLYKDYKAVQEEKHNIEEKLGIRY